MISQLDGGIGKDTTTILSLLLLQTKGCYACHTYVMNHLYLGMT